LPHRRKLTDLTPRQRRDQIISILAGGLARVPQAAGIQPEKDEESSAGSPKKALTLQAKNGSL